LSGGFFTLDFFHDGDAQSVLRSRGRFGVPTELVVVLRSAADYSQDFVTLRESCAGLSGSH
jgi:hypothetical protein